MGLENTLYAPAHTLWALLDSRFTLEILQFETLPEDNPYSQENIILGLNNFNLNIEEMLKENLFSQQEPIEENESELNKKDEIVSNIQSVSPKQSMSYANIVKTSSNTDPSINEALKQHGFKQLHNSIRTVPPTHTKQKNEEQASQYRYQ